MTFNMALNLSILAMMFLPSPWGRRVVLTIIIFPLGLGIGG